MAGSCFLPACLPGSDVYGIDNVLRKFDYILGTSHFLVQQGQLDDVEVVVEQVDLGVLFKEKRSGSWIIRPKCGTRREVDGLANWLDRDISSEACDVPDTFCKVSAPRPVSRRRVPVTRAGWRLCCAYRYDSWQAPGWDVPFRRARGTRQYKHR